MSREAPPRRDNVPAGVGASVGAAIAGPVGSVVGAGIASVLGVAYQNNAERREAFLERLAMGLRAHGLEYASATFGRAAGNLPVWRVTLHTLDGGVQTERVELSAGTEPYAQETCDEVVARVVVALS
jgi:hypothetical protein